LRWTLLGVGWIGDGAVYPLAGGGLMATTGVGLQHQLGAHRAAAVHLDGRNLFRTRISEDMFRGLAPWMARSRPADAIATSPAAESFAAISGSSAATAGDPSAASPSRNASSAASRET